MTNPDDLRTPQQPSAWERFLAAYRDPYAELRRDLLNAQIKRDLDYGRGE